MWGGPDYPRCALQNVGQDSPTAMNSGSHLQYFVFHKEKGCSKLQFIACQVCLTEVWNDKNPSFVPFQSSLFPQCHEILWEVRSTGWYLDATGKVAAVSPPCYLWAQ